MVNLTLQALVTSLIQLPMRSRCAVGIIGALIVVVPLALCAGLLALVLAERCVYHEHYLQVQAEITPILASDPVFRHLEERENSDGSAIMGPVDRHEDLENLRSRLKRRLGAQSADDLVRGVYTLEREKELNEEPASPPVPAPRP